MHRRVKLYARINTGKNFERVAVPVVNGYPKEPKLPIKLKNGTVVDGTIVSYSVRIGNKFEHAGDTFTAALTALREKQYLVGSGIAPISITPVTRSERPTIADAAERWFVKLTEDVEKDQMAKTTMIGYRKAVEDFRDTCGVAYVDQITADVLKTYDRWLRNNLKQNRRHEDVDGRRVEKGHIENTLAARYRILKVFGKFVGLTLVKSKNPKPDDPGLLEYSDVPRPKDITEDKRRKGTLIFSEQELKWMFEVADEDEADLIHFALKTGFRIKAIAAAEWEDVDWDGSKNQNGSGKRVPSIVTGPKQPSEYLPEGFTPKTMRTSQRSPYHYVAIPTLVERLERRRERMQKAGMKSASDDRGLIFPNGNERVAFGIRLLDRIKAVVRRARKKGYKIRGAIGAHRFRKTFGTRMYSHKNDILTAMRALGHGDPQTTMKYLGISDEHTADAAASVFNDID